jgi:flavin-dependent dehydrogenase
MKKTYDIAVLGATAAGYVASATLAKTGHDVILLESPQAQAGQFPTESPLADWIPADTFKTCPLLQKTKTSATDSAFRSMHFYSADLTRQAVHSSKSVMGFTLKPEKFIKTLAASARQAGARIVGLKRPVGIDLQESAVVLSEKSPSGKEFRTAVLLIAHDSPAEAIAEAGISMQSAPKERMTVCGLDVPLPSSRRKTPSALHIAAISGAERFGMFFQAGNALHVRIVYLAGAASNGGEELVRLIQNLQQAELVDKNLDLSRATASLWHPPGGEALDMETHTAKRTLLIGTAGGFASAMTGATLDASIRSALVAADVAGRALRSDRLQETLSEFKDQWRDTIAGNIRPPGTSIQMMLPMALTNKAMTTRFAKAFLHGENI